MEEKPKNVRKSTAAKGRGFYIAMYASLGGLLLLALGIGYYNLIGPGATTAEIQMAQGHGDLFDQGLADFDYHPVGSVWDEPIITRPAPTPAPGQAPTPPPDDEIPPRPRPNEGPQPEPSPAPEGADDEYGQIDEGIYLGEETVIELDIYNVFEPQQSFTYFAEGDTMHWPVLGDVLMEFAMDRLVFDATLDQWRTNDNLAIAANRGDAVRAAADGRVQEIVHTRQFGQTVVIEHGNGWITTYSQLDPDVAVNVGDVVSRGQIIGSVGSPSIFTSLLGYHVGFAVANSDVPVDPGALLTRD